jgi:hypothetical protein
VGGGLGRKGVPNGHGRGFVAWLRVRVWVSVRWHPLLVGVVAGDGLPLVPSTTVEGTR